MLVKTRAASLPLWAVVGLQFALGPVQAQPQATAPASSAAASARPDPSDPKAPVPRSLYASPLRGYQGFAQAPVAPWRETNEGVRQSSGHAGHGMK